MGCESCTDIIKKRKEIWIELLVSMKNIWEEKITSWKKNGGSLIKDTFIKNIWGKIKASKNIGTYKNSKMNDIVIEKFKEILAPPTFT